MEKGNPVSRKGRRIMGIILAGSALLVTFVAWCCVAVGADSERR